MDRYITFTEDGYQSETRLAEESPGDEWYKIPEDIDGKMFILKNGAVFSMSDDEKQAYIDKLEEDNKKFFSRMLRNKKLADSDWTQLESSPLSDTKKAEWEAYRVALRNYPELLESDINAPFPAEPQ